MHCKLFNHSLFDRAILSIEAWATIGLISGVIVLVIGVMWVLFCILLYRHHKEHRSEDDDENGCRKVSHIK